jgi:hypothetical protein
MERTATLVIVIASVAFLPFVGLYSIAAGVGLLSALFGIWLWRAAGLDLVAVGMVSVQVIAIWIAFAIAIDVQVQDPSTSFSLSLQNLLHYTFIGVPPSLDQSLTYRLISGGEGFLGYVLIVSGVATLIKDSRS